MTAIRRRLLPATSRLLWSGAGPPTWAVLVAFVLGGLLGTVLYGLRILSFVGGVAVLLVAVTIPAILDQDGWRIRLAMAWLAAEQRRRMSDLPRTPAEADRWLARSLDDSSPFVRASVLMTAGRMDEARRVVESAPVGSAEDRARATRMLAALEGLETGKVDSAAATMAIDALPPDLRRYHQVSLAWSVALVDSTHRRPWRRGFADASRGIRWSEIPMRAPFGLSVYELLASVVVGAILLVLLLMGSR
jgi:hypothetical protein